MKTVTFTVKERDLLNAKPIYAIKAVRQCCGIGLKEAKNAVDYLRGMCENTPHNYIHIDTGEWYTPLSPETKDLLRSSGLSCSNGNEKTQHYVKQIRELACMMIMDGNEALSRDILDVTEKWGYPNE
jgi:hypothetical protein